MAKHVVVKFIGGGEIGEVEQAAGGRLVVRAYSGNLQPALESLVHGIGRQELTLISGSEELIHGEVAYKTIATKVQPEDPRYLRALADALSKPASRVNGKRVRAYVVD